MKKSKSKLSFSKRTIVSLENLRGGRSETSYSCPGDQCPTKARTCANGPCNHN